MPPFDQIFSICLLVFGLAWIIADSKISFPIRMHLVKRFGSESLLITFLECPPCLSFWIGFGLGLTLYHSLLLALLLAPICVAFSILAWTYVQRGGAGPGTG